MGVVAALDALRVAVPDRVILDGISLNFNAGELIALIGPNGAGKSTLLRAVAGLTRCDGAIMLGGAALPGLNARERARRVAYLAQGGAIHWGLRVRDIVALGRLPHGGGALSAKDLDIVTRVITECGLDAIADRRADELSGGERARALFARALAVEAPLLLVDEPVASLDPAQQLGVMSLLAAEAMKGRAVVAVLHDLGLALNHAHRLIALDRGRVVADGRPADILRDGALERLYGVRFVHAEVAGATLISAQG